MALDDVPSLRCRLTVVGGRVVHETTVKCAPGAIAPPFAPGTRTQLVHFVSPPPAGTERIFAARPGTRGNGHFSLVATAPLPIFMLMLYRAWDSQRLRDAVLAGAAMAWAAFCDPYYAVYCLMLGGAFVSSRVLEIKFVKRPAGQLRSAKHLLDVGIVAVLALIVGISVIGRGSIELGSFRISMRTLYTPMLLLTTLALARIAIALNFRVTALPVPSRAFVLRAAAAAAFAAVVLLSPTLYAVGLRIVEGRMPSEPVFWRSSAQGVDLLAFLVPNQPSIDKWHTLLGEGRHLAATAGSDAHQNTKRKEAIFSDMVQRIAMDDIKAADGAKAAGIELVDVGADERRKFRELSQLAWADWAKKSPAAQKVYDSQVAFLKKLGLL